MRSIDPSSSNPIASEPDLVLRSQAGDSDAFARLYDAYVERIYRYVYFRVADDQTAEDITSQVFLKAWENLDRFRIGNSPFIAWLYRIARNTVIDQYRTAKAMVALDDVAPAYASAADALDEGLDQKLEAGQLRGALQQLTEEQQQVLTMKFMAGLSTPDIAKQMGKRQGAVRALQMSALQALAKALE